MPCQTFCVLRRRATPPRTERSISRRPRAAEWPLAYEKWLRHVSCCVQSNLDVEIVMSHLRTEQFQHQKTRFLNKHPFKSVICFCVLFFHVFFPMAYGASQIPKVRSQNQPKQVAADDCRDAQNQSNTFHIYLVNLSF